MATKKQSRANPGPKPKPRKPGAGDAGGTKVAEQKVQYIVAGETDEMLGTTKLSSTNQITLPEKMVRLLGLKPGDALDLTVTGVDHIIVERKLRGKALLDRLQGSMKGVYGDTKEEIDAYVRGERNSWDREWDRD